MPFAAIFMMLLPVLEVISFVLVSRWIGLAPMLMLWAAFTALGLYLLRSQPIVLARNLTQALRGGGSAHQPLFQSGMVSLAGILFLIPGFFSDAIGLLLLLPPVQKLFLKSAGAAGFQSRVWRRTPQPAQPSRPGSPRRADVIDVEYTEVKPRSGQGGASKDSPWNRPQ